MRGWIRDLGRRAARPGRAPAVGRRPRRPTRGWLPVRFGAAVLVFLGLAGSTAFAASPPTVISAGLTETCAVLADRTVACWSTEGEGVIGTPVTVLAGAGSTSPLSGVRSVASGFDHTCAVLVDETAVCWGANSPTAADTFGGFDSSGGKLGDGTTVDRPAPVTVVAADGGSGPLAGVAGIAVGYFHTCALLVNTTVSCWGDNREGQLGDGTTTSHAAPVTVLDAPGSSIALSGVAEIAAADFHTCALLLEGTVRCWGSNESGRLGDGTEISRPTPVPVIAAPGSPTPLTGVAAISVAADGASGFNGVEGGGNSCALLVDGGVRCWGNASSGQLGTVGLESSAVPVDVTGLSGPATAIAVAGLDTCALLVGGTVECWGLGWSFGRFLECLDDPLCPIGDEPPRPLPVPAAADSPESLGDIVAITAGLFEVCGLASDGRVLCWDGDTAPVAVPGLVVLPAPAITPEPEATPPPATAPPPTQVATAVPTRDPGAAPGTAVTPGSGGSGDVVRRPTFGQSVATPADITLDLAIIAQSVALALAVVLFVPFPAALFNSTLEANYSEIVGWRRSLRRRLRAFVDPVASALGARSVPATPPAAEPAGDPEPAEGTLAANMAATLWRTPPGIVLFLLVSALVASFLDPTFGPDLESLATFAGLALAYAATLLAFGIPQVLEYRRSAGGFLIRALPGTLAVGIACVLISRLTEFQPGYLYGLVIGFVAAGSLTEQNEGRTAAAATTVMLVAAVAAWFGLGWLAGVMPPDGDSGPAAVVLRTALAGVLVAGLEGAALGLLPLRFLAGETIKRWNRWVWGVLLTVATLGYLHVLVNPSSGYLADSSRTPLATIVVLLAGFGGSSLVFWAYFRFRRPPALSEPGGSSAS